MNRNLLMVLLCIQVAVGMSQIGVQVVVQNGSASSECTDPFGGAPDPLFAVSVEGGNFSFYPAESGCYNTLPDTVFQANFACSLLVPVTVELCLRVTENDAFFQPPLGCDIVESCTQTICDNFVVPPFGTTVDYTLSIAAPGSSSGTVNFSLQTGGFAFPDNDFICNAVDLGVLPYGDTLGNMTQGIYANLCATDLNEPNPMDLGYYFTNQAGVWFRFNTGPAPSGLFVVQALSDPNMVGAPIDIELGVFVTDNGACDGNLVPVINYNFTSTGFDNEFRLPCPVPNTDYYILIDGANNNGDFRGIFGLQVWDVGVVEGGDLRCEFMNLGTVPEGGSVSTPQPVANYCATDVQDPFLPTFVSQHSVWFSFVAPPSGHVLIEGFSTDSINVPIGVQLALYRSFNNTCSSFYSYVTSQYTPEDLTESMEVTCLFPGRPYFILVDGSGNAAQGVFELTVTDAGDITPVTDQTITLCAGENLRVGPNTYTATGMYFDTLQVFQGCDSIVNTNLTVLEEVVLTVEQDQVAIGLGGANGIATAIVTGGGGAYTYAWCNGETTPRATALVGGDLCCVTVTDSNGCTDEVCFVVEYTTAIIPTFANDTLLCNGNTDGVITFSAINGIPPYTYTWQNQQGSLSGNGQIAAEGGSVDLPGLPAGAYSILINDNFFDTLFTVLVVEPEELRINLQDMANASCFQFCDGSIATEVTGGTLPYTYAWSGGGGTAALAENLCAGNYQLSVTDANGCTALLAANVDQPPAFVATAAVVQEVSCFAGSDGQAQVTDNGNAVAWNWSNGATAPLAAGLPTGAYAVTVTNSDGCRDTAVVVVPQPLAPLQVNIAEAAPISCFDARDGQLAAAVSGPFANLTYAWNSGQQTSSIGGLDVGAYALTVSNEKGCEALAAYLLDQPTAVQAETFATDINCVDGPSAGVITVENVSGGTPGYTFSANGQQFGEVPLFEDLTAGTYPVVVRDAAGCELLLTTSILPPPDIAVELGDDFDLLLGNEATLRANTNSLDALFTWSHTDTLRSDKATIRPRETTRYVVVVRDTLTQCTAEDAIRVFVDQNPRLYVPNVFSPNNDGSNDTFLPLGGTDLVLIRTLRIFSRGGQLVYEQNDIAPNNLARGWDGTFRGELLNPGVFVYAAEMEFYDGRVAVIGGDVVLMR